MLPTKVNTGAPTHTMPSLDGVRGLAILLVIAHNTQLLDAHQLSKAAALTAYILNIGWVGVPLFFVLSGFLITGILLDSKDHPHKFRNFYARRALRIFPLYYGTLFIIYILTPALGIQPELFKHQESNPIWLWLYLSNWTDSLLGHPNPLAHFWSLSVEEQFYLVWPFLVFWLRDPKIIAQACLIITVISLGSRCILYSLYGTKYLYELTICRMDSLAIGGLIACAMRVPAYQTWLSEKSKMIYITLLAIGSCVFVWTHGLPRSTPRSMIVGYTVLAIIFGAFIYEAANQDNRVSNGLIGNAESPWWHRALCHPAIASIGTYSYGMYILHKPIHDLYSATTLEHLHIKTEGDPLASMAHLLVFTAFIYLLSKLVFWAYETPFLRLKVRFA